MTQTNTDSARFRTAKIALSVIGVVAAAALGYLLRGPEVALAIGAGVLVSELFVLLYGQVRSK
jgi:uncharacterized MnhB-related membrane protein